MGLRLWLRLFVPLTLCFCIVPISARAVASAPVIYATTVAGVAEYNALTGRILGLLKVNNAYGVGVDAAHNLYVGITSSSPASFNVNVYAPGGTKPARVIATNQTFATIAVSPAGELAVAGSQAGSCCADTLEFYAPGATQPSANIQVSKAFPGFAFVAYDGAGNCWVDVANRTKVVFGYVAPGASRITIVPFKGATAAGPLTVDAAGNIVVTENGALRAFTPTGQPVYYVKLMGRPATITGIALSHDNKRLYVANSDTQLEGLRYPSGGRPALIFGTYSGGIAVEN